MRKIDLPDEPKPLLAAHNGCIGAVAHLAHIRSDTSQREKRVWTHDCFGHATTYARPSAGAEKHFAPEYIILEGGCGERLRRNECCRRHRVKNGRPSQFIAR